MKLLLDITLQWYIIKDKENITMVTVREEILTDHSKVYNCILSNGDRKLILYCADKVDAEDICNKLNDILERIIHISIE